MVFITCPSSQLLSHPPITDCVGGLDRPCHGNGGCDGDGTRGGDGHCSCNHGYEGEFCLECIDGYFGKVKNDTFALCTGELETFSLNKLLKPALRFAH